jgi:hypothetical protein
MLFRRVPKLLLVLFSMARAHHHPDLVNFTLNQLSPGLVFLNF